MLGFLYIKNKMGNTVPKLAFTNCGAVSCNIQKGWRRNSIETSEGLIEKRDIKGEMGKVTNDCYVKRERLPLAPYTCSIRGYFSGKLHKT